MANKVDKGLKINYWKLSHRRKFIRTLWVTPFAFFALFLVWYSDRGFWYNVLITVLMVALYIWQLTDTYLKWKNFKE